MKNNRKHKLDDIKKVINNFVNEFRDKDMYLLEGQINISSGELQSFKIVDDWNSRIIVCGRDGFEWSLHYADGVESPEISEMYERVDINKF